MIILPAIPAIVAALTPIINGALAAATAAAPMIATAAVTGAVVGGTACAVGGAVSGYHQHGELNRDVAIQAVQSVPKCAAEGAIVSAVFVPVGLVIGPVVAPAAQLVDDAARSVVQVVDDAVGPAARRVRHAALAPERMRQASANAKNYASLSDDVCSNGCLYIMEDSATGMQKIGVTTQPEKRLAAVSKQVNSDLSYTSLAPVDDAFAVEASLKRQFVSKNVPHPNHLKGTEWYSGLSPIDVAGVMSK